jgi:hypothetical protein
LAYEEIERGGFAGPEEGSGVWVGGDSFAKRRQVTVLGRKKA